MPKTYNILVVDDEQIVLDSIQKHLKSNEDYSIIPVSTAKEALEIIRNNNIHIVLTDLMMPDIDGLELMKLVKEHNNKILMIMITGYATINTALMANQIGAFDYLAKPFTRDELRKLVKRASEVVNSLEDENCSSSTIPEKERTTKHLKGIGEHSWIMREESGIVLVGVERQLVFSIGNIQTVYLPAKGDEIRQGSVYFQIFSNDFRTQSLLAPLSGIVIEVNQKVLENPSKALQEPYEEGWLIRLDPTNFEEEIKLMGR